MVSGGTVSGGRVVSGTVVSGTVVSGAVVSASVVSASVVSGAFVVSAAPVVSAVLSPQGRVKGRLSVSLTANAMHDKESISKIISIKTYISLIFILSS